MGSVVASRRVGMTKLNSALNPPLQQPFSGEFGQKIQMGGVVI